ncbi:MAG: exodeoxyribonuclease V subunit gamma, partial [Rudaea sp.]
MLSGMFDLYSSNDAEALLSQLATRIGAYARAADLLAPEIVLVPQFGLRRWLEIRLAERCGIIANVDFFAPAEYAWRLLRAANPQLPETSLFERNVLRWRIFAQLGELAGERRLPALDAALGEGDQATRLRLAGDLAHWFERYLAYRSDLLERWQRGAEKDDWQAELWRRLTRGGVEAHRARLLADYVQRYGAARRSVPPGIPARISAFACTNISPDLLRFYGTVAQYCEFDFLMPNPCREYWGDVRNERERLRDETASVLDAADNPLLAACGGAGRDFIELLYSYESVQPRFEAGSELSREILRDTLLHRLQADVLDRLAPAPDARADADRRSLQFHICHSKLREVQVLHDRLLDFFQGDPKLTPRDVAVMAPDIAAYAPYVEAVFGGVAREDRRYLPYTLSDTSPRNAQPLSAFALRLAALPLSRLGLSEVIELLGVPAVLRKFDLDRAELDRLEDWLRDAGVRWGLDENQHAAAGAGRYREFSWAFGIERLLLGYASGEDDTMIAGIAPRADVEGNSARTLS